MQARGKMVTVGAISLLVGFCGGTAVGFEIASRFWYRLSRPAIWADGLQAAGMLTMLDRSDEAGLHRLLDAQVDSTLAALEVMRARASSDDRELSRAYSELKEYRARHPRAIATQPAPPK